MRFRLTFVLGVALSPLAMGAVEETGAAIFKRLCAGCHGRAGQGVADKYDEPLQGERGVESLAKLIDRTMPDEHPEKLDAAGSRAVAEYIHGAFYSPQARAKNNPARREPARLTNRQFRESVADLIGSFLPPTPPAEGRGLLGEYFSSDGMNKKAKAAFGRVDLRMDFDFGEGAPQEGMKKEQFSIGWNGSLLVDHTGVYEFRIKTPNGARLYVNPDLRDGDKNSRDDSDAKRDVAMIDAWVSSGEQVREEKGAIFLLGGRRYPLRFDYFKYKDKRGSVTLEWKPPHGAWSVLAAPHIVPTSAPRVAVVATAFPADDGSTGFERGTSVSKAWHEATTKAAIEAAVEVSLRLGALAGTRSDVVKLKEFVAKFAARAFRRPLTDGQRELYVGRHFAEGVPPEVAVKRAVLAILKSPRFLFPELGAPDDHTAASRLALALWDSLPDAPLAEAAGKGELRTPGQLGAQAERMIHDPRAKAKIAEFFRHWLAVEFADDVTKDAAEFPGFDAALVADLRRSLELFVEGVVWGDASDWRQLLLAETIFLNERLAKFYGATPPVGEFDEVKFSPEQRAGIFTHPFLLSVFAYNKSSSPIHRGVFLTRNIMGRFLKPPPQAVEFKEEKFNPSLTMREKVTELTKKAACQSCHTTINPLGFSLEHYDAVGRWRETDGKKPVDAAADYTTPDGEVVKLRGARDLAQFTATSEDARRSFVRQMFQFLVKQAPASHGADTLQKLDKTFVESGTNIRKLAAEIAVAAALLPSPRPATASAR